MYHDTNTVYMIYKIEQQIAENKQKKARIWKERLSPGINNFSRIFRSDEPRGGKQKLWSRQVEQPDLV
jgi:hypothetical protein